MDVKLINPFLAAAMHVLKTMAGVEVSPGKPFLKKDSQATGDVSAIIGITGVASGSMALVFTESCILYIVSKLLGEAFTEVNDEVNDAVGELTNMICGDGRRRLAEEGLVLQAGIPTIVSGKNHHITHIAKGPRLAIPFQTEQGEFMVEVAFANA
ncbi:MAG: chemotaxis protein CheX [Syntrophobacteraceae bacterium]|nr:chemotaxis protein CheX [Syntrophobacteraceae bacterium]